MTADHLGAIAAVLGVAFLGTIAARAIGMPSTVMLVIAGATIAAVHPFGAALPFGPGVLFIFLPALIFEAAWTVDLPSLHRTWRSIAVLAVPGTFLTALVIAAFAAATQTLPLPAAFVLGAIVAATDPVSVVATLRSLAVPRDLATIVEAESLANDGVAVVVYRSALPLALAATLPSGWTIAGLAVASTVGGIAIGIGFAVVLARLIRGTSAAAVEIAATVVAAYAAYALADRTGCSGIFASASAGLALRFLDRRDSPFGARDAVDRFWTAAATIANAIVFAAMGLSLQVGRIVHEPALVAVVIVAVALARLFLAYGLFPLARVRPESGWRTIVAFAGMRGGLSLALALGLPGEMPYRAAVIDAVFAVVLVTLVAAGLTIEPVLRRLGLNEA